MIVAAGKRRPTYRSQRKKNWQRNRTTVDTKQRLITRRKYYQNRNESVYTTKINVTEQTADTISTA